MVPVPVAAADLLADREAVATRHVHVQQDEIRLALPEGAQSVFPVVGLGHLEPDLLERVARHLADRGGVFDHQNQAPLLAVGGIRHLHFPADPAVQLGRDPSRSRAPEAVPRRAGGR
jgi:hypothetical protein